MSEKSRAAELLAGLLASGWTETQLANALIVSPATLRRYVERTEPVPLERQLCLALFIIEQVPDRAKDGRQLRDQVRAAFLYHSHETTVHTDSPPRPVWR